MRTRIMVLLTAVLLASCGGGPANAQTEMKTYKISLQVAGKTLTATLDDNGPASIFPVFGGRKDSAGNYQPGTPHRG